MRRFRCMTAGLALAGHCFAMLGAFALHDVHCGDDCGTHCRDAHAAAPHSHEHPCAHGHSHAPGTEGPDGSRDPDTPHDHENCGWCRFLAIAGTEPQIAEAPVRSDDVVAAVPAFRVSSATPLPSQPSVRGPPC